MSCEWLVQIFEKPSLCVKQVLDLFLIIIQSFFCSQINMKQADDFYLFPKWLLFIQICCSALVFTFAQCFGWVLIIIAFLPPIFLPTLQDMFTPPWSASLKTLKRPEKYCLVNDSIYNLSNMSLNNFKIIHLQWKFFADFCLFEEKKHFSPQMRALTLQFPAST